MNVDLNHERTPNAEAWMIIGRITAGMVVYGGLGWLLSLWLGHQSFFIAVGVLIGMAASLYLVYVRLAATDATATRPKIEPVRRTTLLGRKKTTGPASKEVKSV